MPMKVTVYSMKGGVGKTPIAANLALELGWPLGTNEPFNTLEHLFEEDRLLTISPEETFPTLPDDMSCVFDLAGIVSKGAGASIRSAVTQSDLVIVPVCRELKALNGAAQTAALVEELNGNIVFVATKLEKRKGEVFKDWSQSRDFKEIATYLENALERSVTMIPLKKSKAYDAMFEEDLSISGVIASNPLRAHSFREVREQFDTLIDTVRTFEPSAENVVALNA